MSDAAKQPPFVCQVLTTGLCMKWHKLLSAVDSSFSSLTFHACMVHGYLFLRRYFLFYILYFQLVLCYKSDCIDFFINFNILEAFLEYRFLVQGF